ncbi:Unknown protein sequence [Pseudomonas syringae pv. maculicola]|nr:Unknown protein sequence [Pseudomonas syringae pv. maculicola]
MHLQPCHRGKVKFLLFLPGWYSGSSWAKLIPTLYRHRRLSQEYQRCAGQQ